MNKIVTTNNRNCETCLYVRLAKNDQQEVSAAPIIANQL